MSLQAQGKNYSRYQVIPRTLVFIEHKNKILLLRGAPHKRTWANLYNGLGGHIEANETIFDSARREVAEESGITDLEELTLRGVINIAPDETNVGIMIFIFTARATSQQVTGSEEGTPEWLEWGTLQPDEVVPDMRAILDRLYVQKQPFFTGKYWRDSTGTLITQLE